MSRIIIKSATYLLRETAVTGQVLVAAFGYVVGDENVSVNSAKYKKVEKGDKGTAPVIPSDPVEDRKSRNLKTKENKG